MTDDNQWHLDKRVPIALIVTIAMQSAVIIWWASQIEARVNGLEQTDAERATVEARLVRLETTTEQQTRVLIRIEDKLDRVIEDDMHDDREQ